MINRQSLILKKSYLCICMKQFLYSRSRIIESLIHIIGWGIVFAFPFVMMTRGGFDITLVEYLRHGSIVPLSFLIVFYTNYCFLIPRYLFEGRIKQYLLLNIVLIVCITAGVHFWQEYAFHTYTKGGNEGRSHMGPPKWIFLNPHFLLNTLNNIYALIAFDTDKAQMAVQELSRLLRHVLYDNQQNFVPLAKEIDFIRNYIALMRIRLSSNVTVETRFDIRPDTPTEIAPMIFISLIENAFKHGISPTEPSYIRIYFSESADSVCCEIANSYHPKNEADKSGSGIGLEQVRKRLELTYPGRYEWQHSVSEDEKEYKSILVINH